MSEYVGLEAFLLLWAMIERGIALFGQQQSQGYEQEQRTDWLNGVLALAVLFFATLLLAVARMLS
jgi:hypothetical protein